MALSINLNFNQWLFPSFYRLDTANITLSYIIFYVNLHAWPINHFCRSPKRASNTDVTGMELGEHVIFDTRGYN